MIDLIFVEYDLRDLAKEIFVLETRPFVLQIVELRLDPDGVGRIIIETEVKSEGP